MKTGRDPLSLTPHWHLDCRIVTDLPEDTVVGTRFLINAVASAIALAALLYTGYLGYTTMLLRHQIADWDKRMTDNRAEVREIQRMQNEWAMEAGKIDQAHALVKPEFFVSGFITHLGQTRPEQMVIDMIDWSDAGVAVRGTLRERSERASRMLGGYVEQLRKDPKIVPLFTVDLTDMGRGNTEDGLKFEIVFRLPAKKP